MHHKNWAARQKSDGPRFISDAIASGTGRRFLPVGAIPIMTKNLAAPCGVGHIRPIVLVKTGCVVEESPVDVQDGAFLRNIEPEGLPGDGEVLIAQTQKAAEREHCISNPAG